MTKTKIQEALKIMPEARIYQQIASEYTEYSEQVSDSSHHIKSDNNFTCISCHYWTKNGCHIGRDGYPKIGERCRVFCYEPGVDEKFS